MCGLGENALDTGLETPQQIAGQQLSICDALPAINDLGASHDALRFQERSERLNPRMGDSQVVFELSQVLAGRDKGLRQLAHAVFEGADSFEQVFLEVLLGLDEELLAGIDRFGDT